VGIGAILVVNSFRVISLFYLLQYSEQWFDWAHLYLWDLLIVLDGLLAFFLWARWARRRSFDAHDRQLG
jgi:exosortase/archaeosortase family protein